MPSSPKLPDAFFSGGGLDRCDSLRDDPAEIAALAARDDARELMWTDSIPLLDDDGGLRWGTVRDPVIFLGLDDGRPCFSPIPDGRGPSRAPYQLLAELGDRDAPTLAAALSLANWHRNHRFCSNCGAPSDVKRGGWARHCGTCDAQHFPRVDPVVIMIAEHDGRILLGRQPSFPPGRYSALAGFIEAGETIEAAVARETLEEAGIAVADVRYVASQPWPFPSSLMIGCFATALDDKLAIDTKELEDARWFSRAEVEAALADPELTPGIPPRYAIAHTLMLHWLEVGRSAA